MRCRDLCNSGGKAKGIMEKEKIKVIIKRPDEKVGHVGQ